MSDPKDVAVATATHLNLHPEEHKQSQWRCATGMCFAGHYASISGEVKWLFSAEEMDGLLYQDYLVEVRTTYGKRDVSIESVVVDDDGERWHVASWVQKHMGIRYVESDNLFHYANSRRDIDQMVKQYLNGEKIVRPK